MSEDSMTLDKSAPGPLPCPFCGSQIQPWEAYCEGCGAEQVPTAAAPQPTEEPARDSRSVHLPGARTAEAARPERPAVCRECGGTIDADGYCEQCGTKAPTVREHWSESPTPWVGGVCDRGIRHPRNEDAMALAIDETEPDRAVLVVCDGVSSSADSDVASLAAARTARDLLLQQRPSGLGTEQSRQQAQLAALAEAVRAANEAVIVATAAKPADPDQPVDPNAMGGSTASCTFAAAVVADGEIVHGCLGDSRIYWLADRGESRQLSVDDSVAQMRIAAGVERELAENGPQAHAITKWLGRDAPDLRPTGGVLPVPGEGWLLVCSDGLWNYASTPEELETVVARALVTDPANAEPTRLAEALVDWANAQGGKDNITVALARFGGQALPPG
ncbi:PP2C family protein-serine/threonine phosphatase [Enemella evansiae]|uniref:PP2C family protein-serine/threonine phosphatase n=1 Tax=Enemella evansiae TaxID=2016499 RepID=UPI001E496738|nr:PP2C family serine/threonine-protein phosphatase [Enemella evansiae]